MSHEHLMRRKDPVICQTCREPLSVKHLLVHCHNYIDTRKILEMPDNLFKASTHLITTPTK